MENKVVEDKLYVNSQSLLEDSFRLGKSIVESGFRPDFLVGVWRGGSPVGIAVQEYLEFRSIKTDHIAIRTSGYSKDHKIESKIRVHNLGYIEENINSKNKLLIIDDVFETGLTMESVIKNLKAKLKDKFPSEFKIATVYYKPDFNKTDLKPDFFVNITDKWIVFPHELVGLIDKELKEEGDWVNEFLK